MRPATQLAALAHLLLVRRIAGSVLEDVGVRSVEHGQILGCGIEVDVPEVVAVPCDDVTPASAEPFDVGLDVGSDLGGAVVFETVEERREANFRDERSA